jgi:hypothetical protein
MDMAKKNQKEIVMVQVAILDADGIYQGAEHIAESQVTDAHVLLPDGCDLPPGRYRWEHELKAFMPLQKTEA